MKRSLFKPIFLSFVFFINLKVEAQNLVPNPSFEDTTACPTGAGQVWRAAGWYIAENTPDYLNACCTGPLQGLSVPTNNWGGQVAAHGDAYCAICTWSIGASNFREKLGIQLTSNLVVGTRYYASVKVSNTCSHNPFFNGASNKTGLLFSTSKYDLSHLPPTNNYATIWTDSIFSDTTSWSIIKGSFIADSAYSYITIGNFYDDLNTDTIWHWGAGPNFQSFYFIDDVCVTTDSLGCDFETNVSAIGNQGPFILFPNPADDMLMVKPNTISVNKISIYSLTGNLVYCISPFEQDGLITISLGSLPSGIYFVQVISLHKTYLNKISVYHSN